MKLLIFGSTGSIGRQLVNQALEQGHTVSAFARDATKVDIKHNNLQVAQGDVMDPASVERAVQGHEAVLCSLGAGRKGTVRSDGTRNIISAMEKMGVRRFICQSTLGVGDSRDNTERLLEIHRVWTPPASSVRRPCKSRELRQAKPPGLDDRPSGSLCRRRAHRPIPAWLSWH